VASINLKRESKLVSHQLAKQLRDFQQHPCLVAACCSCKQLGVP
jgi:hypothetical protein